MSASEITLFLDNIFDREFKGSLSKCIYESSLLSASSLKSNFSKHIETHLTQIFQTQLSDGSWATDNRLSYIPDKIINTCANLIALEANRMLTPVTKKKGINFIRRNLTKTLLISKHRKLIGYEAILFELIMNLEEKNMDIGYLRLLLKFVKKIKSRKIRKKLENIYSRGNTIHSALDAISSHENIKWSNLSQFQEQNGSMGIYASSTIALLEHIDETTQEFNRGINYIKETITYYDYLPPFYPSELFEIWWSIYNLATTNSHEINKIIRQYINNNDIDIGVSNEFSLLDVDTTAMKAISLLSLRIDVDLSPLEKYFVEDVFVCYPYEYRTSPSANIHALHAIVLKIVISENKKDYLKKYKKHIDGAFNYLFYISKNNTYLEDKWHLSSLYTASHMYELLKLVSSNSWLFPQYIRKVNELKFDIQRWVPSLYGSENGFSTQDVFSIEENVYALKILHDHEGNFSKSKVSEIIDKIYRASVQEDPPLWLGKTLYKSRSITESLLLSCRHMKQKSYP